MTRLTLPAQRAARPAAHRARLSTCRRALTATLTVVIVAGVLKAADAGWFDRVPLLAPGLAVTVEVLAASALAGAWMSRRRHWLARDLPAVVLAAAVATGAVAAALRLTGTVTDPYPPSFALWLGVALAALIGFPLVVARPGARRRAVAAGMAVPLTLTGALLLINDEYGVWPTAGDLLGHTGLVTGRLVAGRVPRLPPGSVAAGNGVLVSLDPPATRSRFAHQSGSVYLPPAYFTAARPELPVIVMLPGTPGDPGLWPSAGRALDTAQAYAAAHRGRAPVLLFVDPNGAEIRDTECVDGPQGRAEKYLSVDVPAFVTRTLRIPQSPGRWAVAGFSEGGTCAVDLALRHPGLFGRFVDLAGDLRPNLGSRDHTRSWLFGGSPTAMADHDPARLLRTHRYPGMTGWFAAGIDDPDRLATARSLAAAAAKAGLQVHRFSGPGGHNWQFASDAFARVLPSLSADLGLR